jgi:hypothetical protein
MWIGNDVTLRFHDKLDEISELAQKIYDDVMT